MAHGSCCFPLIYSFVDTQHAYEGDNLMRVQIPTQGNVCQPEMKVFQQ